MSEALFDAELQADIAEGRDRMVAPMAPAEAMPNTPGRLSPILRHGERAYYSGIPPMSQLPRQRLMQPEGTMRGYRDDILRATDWLLPGFKARCLAHALGCVSM